MRKLDYRVKQQFKFYTLLSVFYAILMVTAQAVAYRLIKIENILEPGGIFIFPLTFAVNDIIAEVYGPTLARRSIFISLFAQAFYSLIPIEVNLLPYPEWWHHAKDFQIVFGSSWLVFLSNLSAVLVGMVLNTQIIGKTKILARGRLFYARSLLSSAIGEFILTAIIVAIALVPVEGITTGIRLFVDMFLFKVGFSFLAGFPASFLVVLFKKLDNIDIYEEDISFNPLNSFLKKRSPKAENVIDFASVVKQKRQY